MGNRVIPYTELREIPLSFGAKSAVESRFDLSQGYSEEAWDQANDLLALMGSTQFAVDTTALDTTNDIEPPNLGDVPRILPARPPTQQLSYKGCVG